MAAKIAADGKLSNFLEVLAPTSIVWETGIPVTSEVLYFALRHFVDSRCGFDGAYDY